jgi:hypothetical protein
VSKATDTEYEEHTVEAVEEQEGGWVIRHSEGLCFYVPNDHGVQPHVGDVARFYGRGLGSVVRGLDLNGRQVFYRTPEEQRQADEEHARQRDLDRIRAYEHGGRAAQDAQYTSLPAVFQRRIDGFRARNRDFRWQQEAYELACCVDAVRIAAWAGTPARVKAFADLDWPAQKAAIPDLFDGHSGNSFGFACRLAHHYLTNPALVEQEHGALCALVGCTAYGCQYGEQEGSGR